MTSGDGDGGVLVQHFRLHAGLCTFIWLPVLAWAVLCWLVVLAD